MPKIERTREEREGFYRDRLFILNALTEARDYPDDSDKFKKAVEMLADTLDVCQGNLVNICSHLARVAVEKGEVKLGPERDAEKRPITLEDVAILRMTIYGRLRAAPRESQEPEIVKLRRALSRLNPVQLIFSAIYGGAFRHWEKILGRNQVGITVQKTRYFGGIPKEKLPRILREVTRGNLTESVSEMDLRIYPDNMRRIYGILEMLEKDDPTVQLAVEPGGVILERRVSRAGEAKFFLDHLPNGLKPWAATETES